eukprot:m.198185 g.198185  ORF g.198185 m.198185 type:complete len:301 (+) comp32683_c4_seq1:181-1083(+)
MSVSGGDLTCDICGKTFTLPRNLKRHVKLHFAPKLACTWSGCTRTFGRQADLDQHLFKHSGNLKHVCTHQGCKRSFVRASDLRVHLLRHAEEKNFKCLCCPMAFVRQCDRDVHMKRCRKKTPNTHFAVIDNIATAHTSTRKSLPQPKTEPQVQTHAHTSTGPTPKNNPKASPLKPLATTLLSTAEVLSKECPWSDCECPTLCGCGSECTCGSTKKTNEDWFDTFTAVNVMQTECPWSDCSCGVNCECKSACTCGNTAKSQDDWAVTIEAFNSRIPSTLENNDVAQALLTKTTTQLLTDSQ